jgi:hypothetical protein
VHEAVTKQLLPARCTVDLKTMNDYTALQAAERYKRQHAGTATLIRNKKQETPLLDSRVVDESVDESMNGLVAKSELNGRLRRRGLKPRLRRKE